MTNEEIIEDFRRPKKCRCCLARSIHKNKEFGDVYLCSKYTDLCGDAQDTCSGPITKKSLSQMDQIDI